VGNEARGPTMAPAAVPCSRARHTCAALRPSHVYARARQAHGTGYGGTGFKFDTEEDAQRKASRKVLSFAPLLSALHAVALVDFVRRDS